MMYKTCEYCGAHLDPGEPCECRKHSDALGECGDVEMGDALSQDSTLEMETAGELRL